jgi:hypothetical protein
VDQITLKLAHCQMIFLDRAPSILDKTSLQKQMILNRVPPKRLKDMTSIAFWVFPPLLRREKKRCGVDFHMSPSLTRRGGYLDRRTPSCELRRSNVEQE